MKKRQILSIFLAASLLISLAAPALAAETADTIRLTKTEGTVAVNKSSGKKLTQLSNMRLYNGYHVVTEEESYAWLNLDDAKLIKEDAASELEVRKKGRHLEVNVCAGNVFFDVAEKLEEDEILNISTSTMAIGIRGTSGFVQVVDRWTSRLYVLEGAVECTVTDPVTGQVKTAKLQSGDSVECVVYPQERTGDKCDILMKKYQVSDIPGYVLTDLVQKIPLCDKIGKETGLDIPKELAKDGGGDPSGRTPDKKSPTPQVVKKAEDRQDEDEDDFAVRKKEEKQGEVQRPQTISPDKALPSTPQKPASPEGAGGTVGNNPGGDSKDDPTDDTSGSKPPEKPVGMKMTDVQIQALLEKAAAFPSRPTRTPPTGRLRRTSWKWIPASVWPTARR